MASSNGSQRDQRNGGSQREPLRADVGVQGEAAASAGGWSELSGRPEPESGALLDMAAVGHADGAQAGSNGSVADLDPAGMLPDPSLRAPVPRRPSKVEGFDIAENALAVLERRYLGKDRDGHTVETVEEMFRRITWNLAQGDRVDDPDADIEPIAEEFYQMLSKLEFLPNSPTMMNAGRELQQLSACFVLPVPDDMEGIFESATQTALIHKSGGGTGFAFSRLRPENDIVGSTGGIASGPVSFIKIFDTATEVVKQGGTRRGANMGILNVQHPDILKFVHAKDGDDSLQNFNISVAITEEFMQAVEADTEYDLVNPRTGKVTGALSARRVFEEMVQSAWKTGDPGVIFIDRMNRPLSNPVPEYGPIEATNPCGEQPLYPYDSCNLGSINLAKMVTDETYAEIDWGKLERTVFTAVRFLDNVVTMNRYPVPQIEEVSRNIRRIGLGVMGWADLLLILGIPYDSEHALALGEQVMAFIQARADEASAALAEERGVFPAWEGSVYGPEGELGMRRMRNSTRTTIAPTGTISIIASCSSGIEPLFALSYVRNVMDNTRLVEVNPYFEAVAQREGFYSEQLMEDLADQGTIHGMSGIPDWVKRLFVTAHDIDPEWHVRMQAAFQKYTDNAVSKTVNFSHDATVDDVRTVYMRAYELGCKGVTIYRDGSKSLQVLSTGQTDRARDDASQPPAAGKPTAVRQAEEIAAGPVARLPRERPTVVAGITHRVRTGHGNMYVTINLDNEGKPFEVFSALGKSGGCDSAQLEAVSRLASLALRAGVDIDAIVQQLRGITCCPFWDNGVMVRSAPDAVALALSKHAHSDDSGSKAVLWDERTVEGVQFGLYNPNSEQSKTATDSRSGHAHGAEVAQGMRCPDCSVRLVYQEGCLMCPGCGFNKCG